VGGSYVTLEGMRIPLGRLTAEERRFLGHMVGQFKRGGSYLNFENLYMDPESVVFRHAKRLGRAVEETSLYHVCDDLARRQRSDKSATCAQINPATNSQHGEELSLSR